MHSITTKYVEIPLALKWSDRYRPTQVPMWYRQVSRSKDLRDYRIQGEAAIQLHSKKQDYFRLMVCRVCICGVRYKTCSPGRYYVVSFLTVSYQILPSHRASSSRAASILQYPIQNERASCPGSGICGNQSFLHLANHWLYTRLSTTYHTPIEPTKYLGSV